MLICLNIIFISISVCFLHRITFFCNEEYNLYNKHGIYKLKWEVSPCFGVHKRVVYLSHWTILSK